MGFKGMKRDDKGHVISNNEVDGQPCEHGVGGGHSENKDFDNDYDAEFEDESNVIDEMKKNNVNLEDPREILEYLGATAGYDREDQVKIMESMGYTVDDIERLRNPDDFDDEDEFEESDDVRAEKIANDIGEYFSESQLNTVKKYCERYDVDFEKAKVELAKRFDKAKTESGLYSNPDRADFAINTLTDDIVMGDWTGEEESNPVSENEYYDERPDWKPESDEHYSAYDEDVKKGGYSDEDINAVVQLAEEYGKNSTRGFITPDQMKMVAEKMGLSNLSDRDLRLAWDKYYNILGREAHRGGSMKRWRKFGDAQSAFAEVINQEARNRKASGNYFPYDESDVEKAKGKILDIIRPHEGYDLDSAEAYMTQNELSQIEDIADKYHISDEDLRKLHHILNPDASGYRVKGWQPPVGQRIAKEMRESLKMPGDVVDSFLKDLPKEKMDILEEWLLKTKRM